NRIRASQGGTARLRLVPGSRDWSPLERCGPINRRRGGRGASENAPRLNATAVGAVSPHAGLHRDRLEAPERKVGAAGDPLLVTPTTCRRSPGQPPLPRPSFSAAGAFSAFGAAAGTVWLRAPAIAQAPSTKLSASSALRATRPSGRPGSRSAVATA